MTKTRVTLDMDGKIKAVIEEALFNASLTTRDDLTEHIISKLEMKIMESRGNKLERVTKPLVDKVSPLESKMEVYEAHLRKLEKNVDDAEQDNRRSCLRIYGIPLSEKQTSAWCLSKEKLNDVAIKPDLTPRRAKLDSLAREKAKVSDRIEFAFVDINCRLVLNTEEGSLELLMLKKGWEN
eukprot:gene6884-12490_t